MSLCNSKIVVFDLDETLGYFMELGMFWDALKSYIKYKQIKLTQDQNMFNNVLDLYPEFLRPNIMSILNYLKGKKEKNHCQKLMIYTNNQGPIEWANYIRKYFETKLNYTIETQYYELLRSLNNHRSLWLTQRCKFTNRVPARKKQYNQ